MASGALPFEPASEPTREVFHAATVVPLRDTADGPECLMLRKNQGQAFGGVWVFPGGKVEAADGKGFEGARRAAVREAQEETQLELDRDGLVALSHWAPPVEAPKRYLTWFFLVPVPATAAEVTVDGGEIGEHVWARPADVLEAHGKGEAKLVPPTWLTLHWLAEHPDVVTCLRAASERAPEHFTTCIVEADGVGVSLWEPDVAYPTDGHPPGPLDAPGPRHRLYMERGPWRYERTEERR